MKINKEIILDEEEAEAVHNLLTEMTAEIKDALDEGVWDTLCGLKIDMDDRM